MKIIISLLILLSVLETTAQQKRSDILFRAMSEEMERTKTLKLEESPSPFYVEYVISDQEQFEIKSELGTVISSRLYPPTTFACARILLGDYSFTSQLTGKWEHEAIQTTPENNISFLRKSLWEISGREYRRASKQYQNRINNHKGQDNSAGDDFVPFKAVTVTDTLPSFSFNPELWKNNCCTLSALFGDLKNVIQSSVSFSSLRKKFHSLNSEGTRIIYEDLVGELVISCEIQTEDGRTYKDRLTFLGKDDRDFLPLPDLQAQVKEMMQNLLLQENALSLEEYYTGPILFLDDAASTVWERIFLKSDFLPASKKADRSPTVLNPFAHRMKQVIIDKRLTVINRTILPEQPHAFGVYTADAEGVSKNEVSILIKEGVLEHLLTDRYTAGNISELTGSSRFVISGKGISKTIAPACMEITSDKTTALNNMKKQLIKLAKKNNQPYAYIITKLANESSHIHRVDIKTGETIPVSNARLSMPDLNALKNLLDISREIRADKMYKGGVPVILSAPQGFILDHCELEKTQSPLKDPLPVSVSL